MRRIALSSLALGLIGLATALVIHVIYDALLGPDPRRFKLTTNIVMDTTFVLINVLVAAMVAWAVAVATRFPVWHLRRSSENAG